MALSHLTWVVLLGLAVARFDSFEALNRHVDATLGLQTAEASEEASRTVYRNFLGLANRTASEDGFRNFRTNLDRIIRHNRAGHSYSLGLNPFADQSLEELQRRFMDRAPEDCKDPIGNYRFQGAAVPETWDWREKGVVSEAKFQGECGSSYAFAAAGGLESHAMIHLKTKEFLDPAPQQMLDCCGSQGCKGGRPAAMFQSLQGLGGVMAEKDYPYLGQEGECAFDASKVVLKVPRGSFNITASDEAALTEAVALQGPVTVHLNVGEAFIFYRGGIYPASECSSNPEDAVFSMLVVAYGEENGKKFFVCKTSLSPFWGEEGYFRIERGVNCCGVANCGAFPLLAESHMAALSV